MHHMTKTIKARPTQKQIAEKLGLSAATVSLALRDNPVVAKSTRDLVQQAMRETGYVRNLAAASLRTGRSNIVGVSVHDIARNPFGEMLRAIERAFEESGAVILINSHEGDPEKLDRFISTLATYGADALLVAPPPDTPIAVMERVGHHGMPVVYLGHDVLEDTAADRIGMDDHAAGEMAARHLLDAGYKRLCFIGGERETPAGTVRLQGFRSALEAAGIAWDDAFHVSTEVTVADAAACVRALFRGRSAPAGLVCHGDEIGIGAMKALLDIGKVPGTDVGLVGIGSQRISEMTVPPMTMVCEDTDAMGTLGAKTLLARLENGEAEMRRMVLAPRLLVGGTGGG